MSQRPPASRPASHSPTDGQKITLPPVQLREDSQQGGRQLETQQREPLERRGFPPQSSQLLPSPQYGRPLQPSAAAEDPRLGRPRDLAVHSILNPTEPDGTASSGRRVSRGETGSPPSAVGRASQFGASPSTAAQHTFPGPPPPASTPPTQPGYGATFPRGRPILTPRSPRAVSIGRGGGPGTMDAARSPFLPGRGRTYTAEPGPSGSSEVPPMPTPPSHTQGQQHYGFPPPASTPRRGSATMQAPSRTPHSQSASPSISQSSQNPSSSQTSPASYLYKGGPPPPTSQGYLPPSTFTQAGGGMQFQAGQGPATEGPYSTPHPPPSTLSGSNASVSSRQTSASDPIQVLTITTSQGIYNVPVDVHQASRLADEKRARNAGASARFRQRRKEKEREANTTIEKMQSQNRDLERKVRELEQERDFYRGERDRFRDAVYRTPEMRHLAMQGPPSPQSVRTGSFQGLGGPPPPAQPGMGFQQSAPAASVPERAPRRRRTDTSGEFTPVTYALPPAATLPPVPTPGYPAPLPPMRIDNTAAPTQATTGPTVVPATTAAGPFDPYARSPYERGWRGEGGRR